MHQMRCLSHLISFLMQMRRLFQHEFIMTRLMSMVRLQTSSPDKDNENENSNLKAQITIMKKIHSDRNTLRHGGLTTLLNKHAIGLPQPTNAKKQNKTRTLKETTKFQGEKATSPSIIHTPEETTGRQTDGHGIIEWKHVTSKDNPIQHGLDFTTVASHGATLGLEGWIWRIWRIWEGDGHGKYGKCTNEVCFDIFGRIWDFICIIQHLHLAPTPLSLQISARTLLPWTSSTSV